MKAVAAVAARTKRARRAAQTATAHRQAVDRTSTLHKALAGEGGGIGAGGDGGASRMPQSVQSYPIGQSAFSDPGPPSSQIPFLYSARRYSRPQRSHICRCIAIRPL